MQFFHYITFKKIIWIFILILNKEQNKRIRTKHKKCVWQQSSIFSRVFSALTYVLDIWITSAVKNIFGSLPKDCVDVDSSRETVKSCGVCEFASCDTITPLFMVCSASIVSNIFPLFSHLPSTIINTISFTSSPLFAEDSLIF